MSNEENTGNTPAPSPEKKDTRKTIYINRLTLYEKNSSSERGAYLTWGVFDGNPRIIVNTNDPADEKVNYGKIIAPIDAFTAGAVSIMLKKAAKAEPGWREKITNRSTWHNGQKLEQPGRINDIIIGKDGEGTVYISLHEDNRPNIRFFFGPSQWHSLVKSDGTPVSRQELSCIYAESYADMIYAVLATIIGYGSYVSTFSDFDGNSNQADKPTFSKGGGGNSWQGRSGGGQGGYQKGNWQGGQGGGGGYQKGNWQNRNNNQGGQGGYQKGNWQNNRGSQGGGGGYQKGNYQGGNNGGGYQRQASVDDISNEDIAL